MSKINGEPINIHLSAHLRRHEELTNRDPSMEHVYNVARTLMAALGDHTDAGIYYSIHAPEVESEPIGIIVTKDGKPCVLPLWLAEHICKMCGYQIK